MEAARTPLLPVALLSAGEAPGQPTLWIAPEDVRTNAKRAAGQFGIPAKSFDWIHVLVSSDGLYLVARIRRYEFSVWPPGQIKAYRGWRQKPRGH